MPPRPRDYHAEDLRRRYAITRERYEEILERQGGVCEVCRRECKTGRRLAVDHDHDTGSVRGLLCTRCNNGIGNFHDDPDLLRRAWEYLGGARGVVCSGSAVE